MAKSFLTNINMNQNQLVNAVIQTQSTAPDSPAKGQLWFDSSSTTNALKYFDGTNWISASDAPVADVQIDGKSIVSNKVANVTLAGLGITATTANINTVAGSGITAAKVNSYDSHIDNENIHVTADQKTAWDAKYIKPTTGIPESDLEAAVQSSLALADTALQKADISTGTANGTIAVEGTDVAVKGLGSAAYTSSETYDVNGAATSALTSANAYTDTELGKLNLSEITVGAANTISAIKQENGKVTVTTTAIAISSSAVSGLGSAAGKDYTETVTSGSADLITSGAVWTAIDNLPEPMVFKGTVGDAPSTITWDELPTAATENTGWTYKVVTKHTTDPVCEVGDTIVSNGASWVVIPSGDEGKGTVTSIAAGEGLSGGTITSSGTISHAVSTGAAETASGFYKVATDKFGHVTSTTAVAKADVTALGIPAQDTTYTFTQDSSDGHKITLTPSSGTATTLTIPDNNTEYTAGTGLALDGTEFSHVSVGTAGTYGPSADVTGKTINVPYVTTNAQGHVSAAGTHSFTVSGFGDSYIVNETVSFAENATTATVEVSNATLPFASVQVYDASGEEVIMDVKQAYASNKITITFTVAKAFTSATTYTAVIIYK